MGIWLSNTFKELTSNSTWGLFICLFHTKIEYNSLKHKIDQYKKAFLSVSNSLGTRGKVFNHFFLLWYKKTAATVYILWQLDSPKIWTFDSLLAGLDGNWVYGAFCSAQTPHKPVSTSSAKQTTGNKSLRSQYIYWDHRPGKVHFADD
jgi:hypothetical protein